MAINRHHAFVAVCFRISKCSCSVTQQRGASGGSVPGSRPWRHINTLYLDIKKRVFSQKFRPKYA